MSATIEKKNVLVVVVSILQQFCKSQEIFEFVILGLVYHCSGVLMHGHDVQLPGGPRA
jgi:hypothetical protein